MFDGALTLDTVATLMQNLAHDFWLSWGDQGYDWGVGMPPAGKTATAAATPVQATSSDPGHSASSISDMPQEHTIDVQCYWRDKLNDKPSDLTGSGSWKSVC